MSEIVKLTPTYELTYLEALDWVLKTSPMRTSPTHEPTHAESQRKWDFFYGEDMKQIRLTYGRYLLANDKEKIKVLRDYEDRYKPTCKLIHVVSCRDLIELKEEELEFKRAQMAKWKA